MKPINVIFGTVLMAFAMVGTIEWRTGAHLRGEIATLRSRVADVERLRSEQGRLRRAQTREAELTRLRAEREDERRMRGELERMRQRVGERARLTTSGGGPHAAEEERAPTLTEDFVPCAAWKNAGRATPTDAVQTALWAAAGGDLKALAAAIVLEPAARQKADELLARLPPEVSGTFHTAEDFLALFTTTDVPLTEAHLIEPKAELPEGMAVRVVEFRDEKGTMRHAPIVLRRMADNAWRLSVPATAIDKYAASLAGGSAQPVGR